MQQQIQLQLQQLADLEKENKAMKQVKEEIIPTLMDNGLIALNPENNRFLPGASWDQLNAILTTQSQNQPFQNQASQEDLNLLKPS